MGVGASGRLRVSSPAGVQILLSVEYDLCILGKHLGVKAPTVGVRCL